MLYCSVEKSHISIPETKNAKAQICLWKYIEYKDQLVKCGIHVGLDY